MKIVKVQLSYVVLNTNIFSCEHLQIDVIYSLNWYLGDFLVFVNSFINLHTWCEEYINYLVIHRFFVNILIYTLCEEYIKYKDIIKDLSRMVFTNRKVHLQTCYDILIRCYLSKIYVL